jgi:rhomboid protease GluP
MLFLLFLVIVAGYALYVMNQEERMKLLRNATTVALRLRDAAVRGYRHQDPARDALRARTPWVFVTPLLAITNVVIFACMIGGSGSLSGPETLVQWGASVGPRTTNNEWWRLLSAAFVHAGALQLIVNLTALVWIGMVAERLAGHAMVAAIYAAAGMLATLSSLAADPMMVTYGASAAVAGLLGLLLATFSWSLFPGSTMTVPMTLVKNLAAPVALFVLYNLGSGALGTEAELTGFATGFVGGFAVTWDISARKPPVRRLAAAVGAVLVIAVMYALPLRGVADVRPEVERILAIEKRTAQAYQTAVDQFRLGAIPAERLAQLIDRTIVPELRAARARIAALTGVPARHRPVMAATEEYLRLRDECWRLRAEGLNRHNMLTLRHADSAERASLDAFEKVKAADLQ